MLGQDIHHLADGQAGHLGGLAQRGFSIPVALQAQEHTSAGNEISKGGRKIFALRPDLVPVALGLAWLVPMVDVVIGVWSLPWLLYPFGWRDVIDREVAVGMKVRLGFLALVAVLPLGGIALPIQQALSSRRRLWSS
jgi:hypothetical protein